MRERPVIAIVPLWRVKILRRIVNALFSICTRRRITGLDYIPTSGSCLLVFNHVSNFDPLLLFTCVQRADATGLVAADYRANPLSRFVVQTAGGMWIRRDARDRKAIETTLRLLNDGWLVGVAPEGRRSPTHALIEGKPGPAWLALKSSASIVPVGVTNTQQIGRSLWQFKRPVITVTVGKPFQLPPAAGRSPKEHVTACTKLIMCQIAALLPREYQGVCAIHPRLESLHSEARLSANGVDATLS